MNQEHEHDQVQELMHEIGRLKAEIAFLTEGRDDDKATPDEIGRARRLYSESSDDDIEIDDGARASRADEGIWVEAWVWLPNEEN